MLIEQACNKRKALHSSYMLNYTRRRLLSASSYLMTAKRISTIKALRKHRLFRQVSQARPEQQAIVVFS